MLSRTPRVLCRLIKPDQAVSRGVLSDEQVQQWRKHGWCIVNGLIDPALVKEIGENGTDVLSKGPSTEFGSNGMMEFPTEFPAINEMTLSEDIAGPARQLLDSPVLLSQSDVWIKTGEPATDAYHHSDQRIHMDFPNHTLVHPPKWDEPEAVALIVYYSNAEECGGRTGVIPRAGSDDPHYKWPYNSMPGFGPLQWKNERHSAEAMVREKDPAMADFRQGLYDSEKYVDFSAGTVLFYRHDLWHRGTPITPGKSRLVQNLSYKKPACTWFNQWNQGWARGMYERAMTVEKLIAKSTLSQRELLGFPGPESSYWTPDTVEAVRARYESLGMDMSPYEARAASA